MTRFVGSVGALLLLCVIGIVGCDTRAGTGGGGGSSQTSGLYGTVTDTAGDPVASATVILIPSTSVSTVRIDWEDFAAEATDDEPLEDLVNDPSNSFQTATTDASGNYSFANITDGTYFIYLKPADDDPSHLPGGSRCREARQLTDTGVEIDLEASTTPSPSATYVGSTTCLACHPDQAGAKQTGHFNGLRVPGSDSGLQDISMFDGFDGALDRFDGTTTVYFYDYDGTRGFDKYKTRESDPGVACGADPDPNKGVRFTARLFQEGSAYKMELTNVCNPADPNSPVTLDLDLSYGGAVYKQRYVTNMGDTWHVLPLQYQVEGSEANTPRTRKVWRDYHAATSWYNETTKLFKTPANSKSFDKNCAGCHFTGYSLAGSDDDGWAASAVSDANGTIDYDGDGDLDEINTGCEVCHGPGSEHVAAAGAGRSIVHPGLITPERESMICGRCHGRPKGFNKTDVPDNEENAMMPPGLSRSEFLAGYTATQRDGAASDFYTDPDQHSKSHHQQYTDFIRSSHYKNGRELVTCSSCHNMHGSGNYRGLRATTADNALCATCHLDKAAEIVGHYDDELRVDTDMGAVCVDCHMSKFAKTGAGAQGAGDYWENDVTGHLFAVPAKSFLEGTAVSDGLMPLPYTNSCGGSCHDTDLSDN